VKKAFFFRHHSPHLAGLAKLGHFYEVFLQQQLDGTLVFNLGLNIILLLPLLGLLHCFLSWRVAAR
jgi:hypothetical protein